MLSFKANLIEVITLILSCTALFISWRNRKSTLRENLYNRQVDEMSKIFSQLVDVEEMFFNWGTEKKYSKPERIEELRMKLDQMINKVDSDFSCSKLVLPDSIVKDFTWVIDYFFMKNVDITLGKVSGANIEEVNVLMYNLSNSIRDFIGLEKLSSVNQRVIRN